MSPQARFRCYSVGKQGRLMSGKWCVCLAERPRSGAMSRHKSFAHMLMRVRRVQYQVGSGLAPTSYPT
jgi:hypothetical protein